MRKFRVRFALTGVVAATTLLATACPQTPPYAGPPTATKTFQADQVTVNSSNDKTCVIVCFGANDEPKVINIGFRVKLGVANSASANVVIGDNHWGGVFTQGPGEGGSYTYQGGERGAVTFSNVAMPDILDLAQGAPIEIAGVWAWKVEDDGVLAANANNMANAIAQALIPVLNSTVAAAAIPSDPNQIVNTVLSAIGNLGFFNLFATGFTAILNNLNIASDDVLGSAMYIGIGSSGTLASIIDGATAGATFPSIAIPALSTPPDIGGGSIFSLGTGTKSFTDSSTNGGVSGQHTTTYTFG